MDCNTPLEKIIERCLEIGINCIAIADHGTVEGALKMKAMAPFTVIVAEEIETPHGEIMGMFLQEGIPSGLSVEETLARIRAQSGLVCIPHPFDPFRQSALDNEVIEAIVDQIDIVEVFNARAPLQRSATQANSFADKYSLAKGAGSDAHTITEIGNAYVEILEFSNKDDFIQALRQGKIGGHKTPYWVHARSVWARFCSIIAGIWTRLKNRSS